MLRAAVNENIASINLCYVLSNLNLYKTDKNLHLPFFFFSLQMVESACLRAPDNE